MFSQISKFFPVPKFLSKPSFGLDISDESLRFVELVSDKNGISVFKYGERKIPPGVIESGKIKKPEILEGVLSALKKEEGIESVRVSLPEEQIYVFQLRLEKKEIKSIEEGIELSLEEHVPISAQEAIFDYELLAEDATGLDVQVAVILKGTIESYLSAFKNSGISVISFEPETQAIVRSIIKKGDPETYMIVDFGEKRAGISIVSAGIVMFTSTIDIGGAVLTETIQKNLNISFEEAEKMKLKYGLMHNAVNEKISSILLDEISVLRDEINKHYLYWHTYKDEDNKDRPAIKKIIFCGGESNLIGLPEYFSVALKTKIELANVWVNMLDLDKYIPEINFDQSLSFVTAIGLVLGDLEND